jgi:CRP-like cAMP-binding protein
VYTQHRHWSHEARLPELGICVGVAFSGMNFGQYSMMTASRSRHYSAVAREDCLLLAVPRQTYLHGVLLLLREDDRSFIINTLKKNLLFSRLTKLQMSQLASRMEERYYTRHELLLAQGERTKRLFFIMQGEVGVSLSTNITCCPCKLCNTKAFKKRVHSLFNRYEWWIVCVYLCVCICVCV